jgi:hypothetical protein
MHEMKGRFGKIIDGVMELNEHGWIAGEEWVRSAQTRGEIDLDGWGLILDDWRAAPRAL